MRHLDSEERTRADVRRHAIVVGGSIAGLLAARVLTDHFEKVTIIERDILPHGNEDRPGSPQARHLHLLLMRGLEIIGDLFPEVKAEMIGNGAHVIDQGKDFHIHYLSGWAPQISCNLPLLTFTRPLLESTIRRHLREYKKVEIREGLGVSGFLLSKDARRVTGVRFRPRGAQPDDASEEQQLTADLVVDASGRNSRAPEWLEEAGFAAPAETVVDASWGYATRVYEVPEGFQASWKSLLIMHRPPVITRAGIIQPIEGNRWIVTLAGVMEDYPPTDEEGFLEYARTLKQPDLYESIRHAKPLTRIWGFRRTENRLRHYHQMARMPDRFVALGDALCAFTPVYGQGLTTSALGADELRRCLVEQRPGKSLDGMTRKLQKRLAKMVSGPWDMATGEDLRWPATRGGKITLKTRLMQWYMYQVLCLIPESAEIFRRFQQVNHMVKPLPIMFHPSVLLPVMKRTFLPQPKTAPSWVPEEAGSAAQG